MITREKLLELGKKRAGIYSEEQWKANNLNGEGKAETASDYEAGFTSALDLLFEGAEALHGCIVVADRNTIEFKAAREFLAKLEGELR